jgi:hypothetical protein
LHGMMDRFALANRLFWVLYPMMMTRLMASRLLRSGDRHFTKISREMGKLLTRFLLIRKDFGTPRLFEPFGGKFREDVSRQDCELLKEGKLVLRQRRCAVRVLICGEVPAVQNPVVDFSQVVARLSRDCGEPGF